MASNPTTRITSSTRSASPWTSARQDGGTPSQQLHRFALQFTEVAETDSVARAVNAVDDDADRAFQTRVVANGTDAADTSGR
jgi:hypothetical protein